MIQLSIKLTRVLILVSVLLSACSVPSTSITLPVQPTDALQASPSPEPTIDLPQLKATLAAAPQPANLAEAEGQIRANLRSYVRDFLGEQADEVFRRLDAAEQVIYHQALDQIPKPQGYLPAQKQGTWSTLPRRIDPGGTFFVGYPASVLPQTMVVTTGALMVINAIADYAWAPEDQPYVDNITLNLEGGQAILKIKFIRQGSIMRADVEGEATLNGKDGMGSKETFKGYLDIDLCPDKKGGVLSAYGFTWGIRVTRNGIGYSVENQIFGSSEGQVNDNADLSGVVHDLTSTVDINTVGAHPKSGGHVELGLRFSSSDMSSTPWPADLQIEQKKIDSFSNDEVLHQTISKALTRGVIIAQGLIEDIFKKAQKQWQDGFCLEVVIDGIERVGGAGSQYKKAVDPGTVTSFTVRVHHKFEDQDLPLPVEGSLNGEKSLDPGGKAQAPVNYSYQAPDAGNQYANINLESRSRRGVATEIAFMKIMDYDLVLTGVITNAYKITGGTDGGGCEGTITFTFSAKLKKSGEVDPGTEGYRGNGTVNWVGEAHCAPSPCQYSGQGSSTSLQLSGKAKNGVLTMETMEIFPGIQSEDAACGLKSEAGVQNYGDPRMPLEIKDGSKYHLRFDASDRYAYPLIMTIDLTLHLEPVK